jgi:hypothetical protein
MPKRISQLSDTRVRNAKADKTDHKLFDGGGLYLAFAVGRQALAYEYRYEGKEKKLRFGPDPDISLSEAR